MGSAFGVLCCREQGTWNGGGGGIIEAVTERYCNPVSLRFDPENLDHTKSLQDEEKWAQTTTE